MSFAELFRLDPKLAAELVSTFLGIVSVALLARGDGRGWPVGGLWALLCGVVYWLENIQGQAALQVYFLVAQLIGWRRWAKGTEPDLRRGARLMTRKERALTIAAWLVATVCLAALLKKGGSKFVELDAFTTIGSLLGQALIVAGFAESWLAYLAVDVLLIGLSVQAELWPYVAMYLVYCALAWQGWRGWTRDAREEKRNDAPNPK